MQEGARGVCGAEWNHIHRNPTGDGAEQPAVLELQGEVSLLALLKHGHVHVVRRRTCHERPEEHDPPHLRLVPQAGHHLLLQRVTLLGSKCHDTPSFRAHAIDSELPGKP